MEYFIIFQDLLSDLKHRGKSSFRSSHDSAAAIPISTIILLIRRAILHHQLKTDKSDNATLYREIGRLNKQVLSLMDEKNSILALKVNAMGGTEKIPYMGASALTDDVIPTVKNVTGITGGAKAAASQAAAETAATAVPGVPAAGTTDPAKAPVVHAVVSSAPAKKVDHRFPKLSLWIRNMPIPVSGI